MTATTLVAPISLSTDLLTGAEWSPAHTRELLHLSADIKARPVRYASTLHGKCIALIFEKPSLRTRVTFDVGIQSMGGAVVFLDHTQASASLGKRESIADVARNLDRWVHGIVARVYSQKVLEEMAANASIPVINALSDKFHPCQALAGMELVGKRVDHRNAGVCGHFLEHLLRINARHDAVNPAVEVARHIRYRFPLAERSGGLRVIKEHYRSAHALNPDIEGDARTQRGLFENQGNKFAVQRGGIATGSRFDVRCEVEEFARMRGTPFRSSEEIGRQGNRSYERSGSHSFYPLAAAWTAPCGMAESTASEAEACFGVFSRTIAKSFRNSRTCARVIIKGGRRRSVKSCVQLISKPRCMASATNGPPSRESSIPIISPSARISRTKSNCEVSLLSPSRSSSPRARMFSRSFSSST